MNTTNKLALDDFKEIPKQDQVELLCVYAECIDQIEDTDLSYTLFTLDGFFVEMIQDNNGYEVIGVNAFKNGPQLNKYAEFNLFNLY